MTERINLGILRLSDAAPVMLADATGLFAANGIEVSLSIEPSWANVADKLGYGLLDGAVMPPPLAMASALGLRGHKIDMVIPMSMSANGNTIVLGQQWRSIFARGAAALKAVTTTSSLRFAVVHAYSTHDLLLRYWLAASGIDPDRDIEITVLPPTEMPAHLAAGKIDGFCAGAPWGLVAERMGAGFNALNSREVWRDHPEKCLGLRADFAYRSPAAVQALLLALRQAAATCANPDYRSDLARLIAGDAYLGLPVDLVEYSLDTVSGGPVFDDNYPLPAHAEWFAAQLLRWNKLPQSDVAAAAALYRPDLFLAAGGSASVPRDEKFFGEVPAA